MSHPLLEKINPSLKNLPFYQPGRPIEEVARELGMPFDGIIKLASNENPLGPSPRAMTAMQEAIKSVHLYPDGNAFYLKKTLSQRLGVSEDMITLGNGSNEIIEFLAHAFIKPDSEVICSQYCFAIYPILTLMMGGKVVEVPANGLAHDLKAMSAAVNDRTAAIFIANPNNPTGTLAKNEKVIDFINSIPNNIPVIVDEAYVEYLDNPVNVIDMIQQSQNSNIIIMRTFSKIFGLAGLRIGYGIGHPEIINALERIRQPFNTNLVAQKAAEAAINDEEHLQKSREINAAGLQQFESGLKTLSIPYERSFCNFILAKVGNANEAFQFLQSQGIITRPMAGYKLPEWLRISVGTESQNDKCLHSLKQFIETESNK